jgi:hypothetical protein
MGRDAPDGKQGPEANPRQEAELEAKQVARVTADEKGQPKNRSPLGGKSSQSLVLCSKVSEVFQ